MNYDQNRKSNHIHVVCCCLSLSLSQSLYSVSFHYKSSSRLMSQHMTFIECKVSNWNEYAKSWTIYLSIAFTSVCWMLFLLLRLLLRLKLFVGFFFVQMIRMQFSIFRKLKWAKSVEQAMCLCIEYINENSVQNAMDSTRWLMHFNGRPHNDEYGLVWSAIFTYTLFSDTPDNTEAPRCMLPKCSNERFTI